MDSKNPKQKLINPMEQYIKKIIHYDLVDLSEDKFNIRKSNMVIHHINT